MSKSKDPTQELISFIEDPAHVDDFLRPQTGNLMRTLCASADSEISFVDLILGHLYRLVPFSTSKVRQLVQAWMTSNPAFVPTTSASCAK
jgi:hypothetical protein